MTDISDLSNNFIQLLTNYINISNSNSSPLSNNYMINQSLSSEYSRFNRILNSSFLENPVYKKILSNKGTNQMKTIIYDDKKYETKECVISMNEFKNGDEIIQLPCKHIFHKESIETWLKEESSKCPICRFELDYKEVKNDDNIIVEDFDTSNNMTTDISNNVFDRFSDLIYNPTQNIFRPQRNNLLSQRNLINEIINEENSYLEQRYLQNAIIASLHEEYTIENNDSDEECSLEDFIDIFLEEEKENDLLTSDSDDDLYNVN